MQEIDAQRLLDKFRAGQCTEEEKVRLRNWFHLLNLDEPVGLSADELEDIGDEMWANLSRQTKPATKLWPKLSMAAAVLLVAGAAATIFLQQQKQKQTVNDDVAPFTAAAILKTHGKTILLEKAQNGKIQSNITKTVGEQLIYSKTGEEESTTAIAYDTIQIPAGGRPYTVQLVDGSKITLNAATTLRYPNNKRATVELIEGEIYAEIVHQPKNPLTIKAPNQTITDIGTEFNVSAYANEETKVTTLINGKIKVNQIEANSPGQQFRNNELSKDLADINQTTAWKKGDFYFKDQHLDVIMRELARWYNIEVAYQGKMTSETFYLIVDRKRKISAVLHQLEKTKKVKFKIEGRRVTVLNVN